MEWNQTFGGFEEEEAWALLQTDDGGFLFSGWTKSYDSDGSDIWVIKTNSNGVIGWNQTYGSKTYEYAYDLIKTSDGQFVIAGSSLIKINETGKVKWSYSLNRKKYSVIKDIIVTPEDYFIITGQNLESSDENIYLAKVSETTLARKVTCFDIFSLISAILIITIWIKRKH
ncbi:MAG: hypothetical protein ACFE9L_01645 [Candidatus Hodarchaeota archaeon]